MQSMASSSNIGSVILIARSDQAAERVCSLGLVRNQAHIGPWIITAIILAD